MNTKFNFKVYQIKKNIPMNGNLQETFKISFGNKEYEFYKEEEPLLNIVKEDIRKFSIKQFGKQMPYSICFLYTPSKIVPFEVSNKLLEKGNYLGDAYERYVIVNFID